MMIKNTNLGFEKYVSVSLTPDCQDMEVRGEPKITYSTERLRELQMYNQCFALRSVLLVPFLFLLLTIGRDVTGKGFDQKPNFVLMVVDDLGIGDIGCYGNDTIR